MLRIGQVLWDLILATKKEKAWLNKVSMYGCLICRWYYGDRDSLPAMVHHIRDHTGMGRKDSEVIPLCYAHHQGSDGIHHIGKKTWESKYDTQRNLYKRFLNEIGDKDG